MNETMNNEVYKALVNPILSWISWRIDWYLKEVTEKSWKEVEWYNKGYTLQRVKEKVEQVLTDDKVPNVVKNRLLQDVADSMSVISILTYDDATNLRDKREKRSWGVELQDAKSEWFENWFPDGHYVSSLIDHNFTHWVDKKVKLIQRTFTEDTVTVDWNLLHKETLSKFINDKGELDKKYWIDTSSFLNERTDLGMPEDWLSKFIVMHLWSRFNLTDKDRVLLVNTNDDLVIKHNGKEINLRQLMNDYSKLYVDYKKQQLDHFQTPRAELVNGRGIIADTVWLEQIKVPEDFEKQLDSELSKTSNADLVIMVDGLVWASPVIWDVYGWLHDLGDWYTRLNTDWVKASDIEWNLNMALGSLWIILWTTWLWSLLNKVLKADKLLKLRFLWKILWEVSKRVESWKLRLSWEAVEKMNWIERKVTEWLKKDPSELKVSKIDAMNLNDLKNTYKDTIDQAEKLLGKELNEKQIRALVKSHTYWEDWVWPYTDWEKTVKWLNLMRDWVFTREEAQLIMDNWIAWEKRKWSRTLEERLWMLSSDKPMSADLYYKMDRDLWIGKIQGWEKFNLKDFDTMAIRIFDYFSHLNIDAVLQAPDRINTFFNNVKVLSSFVEQFQDLLKQSSWVNWEEYKRMMISIAHWIKHISENPEVKSKLDPEKRAILTHLLEQLGIANSNLNEVNTAKQALQNFDFLHVLYFSPINVKRVSFWEWISHIEQINKSFDRNVLFSDKEARVTFLQNINWISDFLEHNMENLWNTMLWNWDNVTRIVNEFYSNIKRFDKEWKLGDEYNVYQEAIKKLEWKVAKLNYQNTQTERVSQWVKEWKINYDEIWEKISKSGYEWKLEDVKVTDNLEHLTVVDFENMNFVQWFSYIKWLAKLDIKDIIEVDWNVWRFIRNMNWIKRFLEKNSNEFNNEKIVLVWDLYVDILNNYMSLLNNLWDKVNIPMFFKLRGEITWMSKDFKAKIEGYIWQWLKDKDAKSG